MDSSEHTALEILKQIRKAGFTAFFAGGSVRDKLLGREAKDYDVATSATPDQIEALFPKTVAVGKAFGVIVVVQDGTGTEVATFRADSGYQDGRRPDSIHFCGAEEDAKRRDFTVNGMFYDPVEKKVIDYVGGQEDLQKKIIRAIGEPEKRFAEDHLRMLRAVRFAHTLGFTIEPATRAAIQKHAPDLAKISAERIENEFSRTLTESIRPGDALRELVELGLMKFIIPEILPMIGQEQPPQFHPEGDVFEHTVLMLNLMKNCGAGTPACGKTADEGVCPAENSPFRSLDGEIHRTHRRLPHWQQQNRIYFITFRTNDSLPISKQQELKFTEEKEAALDQGYGECHLRNSRCRALLESTLLHENGIQYELLAYVIMPNHVHILTAPYENVDLSNLVRTWKSISARKINRLLNRIGPFWLDESFDHIVRSQSHLENFIRYIQGNPEKAHLKNDEYSLFVAQTPSSAEKPVAQTPSPAEKPVAQAPSPAEKWQTRASAPPSKPDNFKKLLAYTALLHDIGKPATAVLAADRLRFHGHDRKSAEMAEEILRRLKLPVKEIRQIVTAIDRHMRFKDVQKMNKSTLRKLMGAETFDLELELHRLDCAGSHRLLDNYQFLLEKAEAMKSEPILPERWITGKDLQELGVAPGSRMGELIQLAYDAQLETRFEDRTALLDWLKAQLV